MNNHRDFIEWDSKLLCEECGANPHLTARTEKAIITYCIHNKAGGFLRLKNGKPAGPWTFFQPISIDEFIRAILEVRRYAEKLEKIWGQGGSENFPDQSGMVFPSLVGYFLIES